MTRSELEDHIRCAPDNKFEFGKYHFVPLHRDALVQFIVAQEPKAPVESWVAVMAVLCLGWAGFMQKKVFLAHSSKDKAFVRNLAKSLQSEGFNVWLDEAEIKVGESLITKLSSTIVTDVDFVVAVISENSAKSNWVQKELEWASTKEIRNKKVMVLPVLRDDSPLPAFLSDKLYADYRKPHKMKQSFNRLVQSIRSFP